MENMGGAYSTRERNGKCI